MSDPSTAVGRGKLILFGEHAVVFGHPAVACSLPGGASATISRSGDPSWSIRHPGGLIESDDDVRRAARRLLAEFDLRPEQLQVDIELTIPVGAGLGSSAAMAVAVARAAAVLQQLDRDLAEAKIDAAVAASETVFHGTPSGIDQQAAMGGGFFSFQKSKPTPSTTPLDVPPGRWLVARVAPSASTAQMVESVASLRRRQPEILDSLLCEFASLTRAGTRALESGSWDEVGELMDLNQGLLNAIGVSTPELESACSAARTAGAYGAKLTGSGGGGCIVALVDEHNLSDVQKTLQRQGDVYSFSLPSGH